jgi:hypothetical protein
MVLACLAIGQELISIEVKGVGPDRTQAIEDAKRAAVEQALGTAVTGITEMENFKVIKDIVRSRSAGYVSKYEVTKETPFPDRFEVMIKALVSSSPLKADVKTLQASLGGFRIMTFYDFRKLDSRESLDYEYAYQRVNEFLGRNKLRYVQRNVFEGNMEDARKLFPDTTRPLTVAQYMAVQANVPVFWEIHRLIVTARKMGAPSPTGGNIISAEASVDLEAYDAHTAEGMGAMAGKGEPAAQYTDEDARRNAIESAVERAAEKLLFQMNVQMADWLLNGKPYSLRFYGIKSYKDLAKMKTELKNDPRFGGQMEIASAQDYAQLDITFKGAADELADAVVLEYAPKFPEFRDLDVVGFFKNQINFALPGANVPKNERSPVPSKTK